MLIAIKDVEPGLFSLWRGYIDERKTQLEWNYTYFMRLLDVGGKSSGGEYGDAPSMDHVAMPHFDASSWSNAPARTVIIPVNTPSESFDNLKRTLRQLKRACKGLGRTEVIIWFNTWVGDDMPQAMRVFYGWVSLLQASRIGTQNFRVRALHKFRTCKTSRDGAFNELRSHYMDYLIWEAQPRHFEYMHPVWWFDADTPFIARGAIRECERALQQRKGHFIKCNLEYVADDPYAPELSLRLDCEKVAGIYALTLRMLERNLAPTISRGYVEESGLLMALGNYIVSGGVGLNNPLLGESRTMLGRAARVLDPSVPLVWYVAEARVGNSYRRLVDQARTDWAWNLVGSEEGPDYQDYHARVSEGLAPTRTAPVTIGEVREMVRLLIEVQLKWGGNGLTESQERRLELAIQRCGFAADETPAPLAQATLS